MCLNFCVEPVHKVFSDFQGLTGKGTFGMADHAIQEFDPADLRAGSLSPVPPKYETDAVTARSFCESHGATLPMFASNSEISEVFKCLNQDYDGWSRRITILIGVNYTGFDTPILTWLNEPVDFSIWRDSDPNGVCDNPTGADFCCAKLSQRSQLSGEEITGTVIDNDADCDRNDEPFMCRVSPDVQLLGDECALDLHTCSHLCFDAFLGYTCSCPEGYTLDTADQHTCLDIDECEDSSLCTQVCVNTEGGYSCDCHGGYSFHEGGIPECVDVDECLLDPNKCDSNTQTCSNTDGRFLCECLQGYRSDPNVTETCIDIDECLENNDNCLPSYCVNSFGGFYCACPDGYHGDGIIECLDMNECFDVDLNSCDQTCINTQGGYSCSCNDGYVASNSTHCVDIDECSSTLHSCNQTCVNTEGSYFCTCSAGFRLSNNSAHCLDIDECEDEVTYKNLCDQVCSNTHGSFRCSCLDGYVMTPNGTCVQACECSCHNSTNSDIDTATEAIRKHLTVPKQELSSYTRTKTSASDTRTSAQTVGYFGLVLMLGSISVIICFDVSSIIALISRKSSKRSF
ncbi:latent-transforming growth factor beta-binding protein 2 [Plakobranchus ocellatus]|uniref:Latent-transforming growth factor beta-binding protein 2 n=1 Tax=Plakobranchus ocellatus TaxID=259542 RepID=A0AAV3ZE39_9GAST|nr:latent-transforming growth factor beta-binding protein 2 [Plakobranchus ocellatus]